MEIKVVEKLRKLRKMKKVGKTKKAMESEVLGWVLLGLLALAICLGAYAIISGKGGNMIDYIKNLVRFGK